MLMQKIKANREDASLRRQALGLRAWISLATNVNQGSIPEQVE